MSSPENVAAQKTEKLGDCVIPISSGDTGQPRCAKKTKSEPQCPWSCPCPFGTRMRQSVRIGKVLEGEVDYELQATFEREMKHPPDRCWAVANEKNEIFIWTWDKNFKKLIDVENYKYFDIVYKKNFEELLISSLKV